MEMSVPRTAPTSKGMLWTGRILSAIPALFLLADGGAKLFKPAPVLQATQQLGYPESAIVGMGIALLVGVILYIIPRTAVLGAIVITGYLGGAIASHVRMSAPLFEVVFPGIFATVVWLGLWLRDARLRALVPFRT